MDRFVTLDGQGQFYSVCTFCKKNSFSTLSREPKTSLSLLPTVLLNGHSLYIIGRRDEEEEKERKKGDGDMSEKKTKEKKDGD